MKMARGSNERTGVPCSDAQLAFTESAPSSALPRPRRETAGRERPRVRDASEPNRDRRPFTRGAGPAGALGLCSPRWFRDARGCGCRPHRAPRCPRGRARRRGRTGGLEAPRRALGRPAAPRGRRLRVSDPRAAAEPRLPPASAARQASDTPAALGLHRRAARVGGSRAPGLQASRGRGRWRLAAEVMEQRRSRPRPTRDPPAASADSLCDVTDRPPAAERAAAVSARAPGPRAPAGSWEPASAAGGRRGRPRGGRRAGQRSWDRAREPGARNDSNDAGNARGREAGEAESARATRSAAGGKPAQRPGPAPPRCSLVSSQWATPLSFH